MGAPLLRRQLLRRQLLRRQLLRGRLPLGLHNGHFVARPIPIFSGGGRDPFVEIGSETEDLCIGWDAFLGGRLFPRLLPFDLHLRANVAFVRLFVLGLFVIP